MQAKTIESAHPVGRPPSENPRNVTIGYRIDQATADDLDAELAQERRPGLVLSRNDVARMLMTEALEVRKAKRKHRK